MSLISNGPALPPEWSWARLADVADLKGGITKGQKRGPADILQAVPYLRVANVQRGFLDLSEMKTIEATAEEISELHLQPGDVLFNEGGDRDKLGRGWVWRGELPTCIHQNHVFRARLRSGIVPKFLSYYGNSAAQEYFLREGKQTTNLASINLTKLANLPVPVPPTGEQLRIVAELDKHFTRLDAAVAALKRVQVQLKRYRASVLKAAVEGRLVATEAELARREGRPFESGQELRLRILRERQDASIPNNTRRGTTPAALTPVSPTGMDSLPEGWTWATVDELADAVTYGTSAKTGEAGGGVPILRMGNLVDGRLVFDTLKFLPADHAEFPALLLHNGDLLFNRTNSAELVGKTAVFHGVPTPCSFASYLISVRFSDSTEPEFVSIWLNSTFGRAWVKSVAVQQVGQANVNGSKLRALAVPLPPENEQRRIVLEVQRLLSLVDAQRQAVARALGRAEVLRRSALHRAFSGHLVPQDPSDEPAAALLERIRAERQRTPSKTRKARNSRPTSSVESS